MARPRIDTLQLWAPFLVVSLGGSIAVAFAQPFADDGYTEASFSRYIGPPVTASVPVAICAALLARRWLGLATFGLGSLVAGAAGGALYAIESGADIRIGADRGDIGLAVVVNCLPFLYPLGLLTYVLVTFLTRSILRTKKPPAT